MNNAWTLANLTDEQLGKLKDAEQTLGPFNLLAYQPLPVNAAQLTASQMECLQGLEKILGLTIVAYQK